MCKSLTHLWILCTILVYFKVTYSIALATGQQSGADRKIQREQWNQWPIAPWDPTAWPSTQWNGSQLPSSAWNQTQWPSGQWQPPPAAVASPVKVTTVNPWWPPTHRPVNHLPTTTLYPPLPSYTPSKVTHSSVVIVNQKPTTIATTQPSPVTTTTHAPTVRPTTTTSPTASPTANDSLTDITVKSCGLSHIPQVFEGNKIVLGKVAKGGEFPWQTILKIHTDRGPMQCGGAILNSRWVLTAAHCVSNERNGQPTAKRVDITAGIHNRLQMSVASQRRTADCVVQHEGWSGQYGKFKHDIALIRLPDNQAFDINHDRGGHINGICLPANSMSEYQGKGRIAGWGLTKDRGQPSDVLMYTDVSILSNSECRRYPYPVPISEGMMCQGVDRTAPCQGDSGGPLIVATGDHRGVQRMTEMGIVSFGPGECANAQTPNAVYTKVSHYLKWISKNIKANSGARCSARSLQANSSDIKIDDKDSLAVDQSVSTTTEPTRYQRLKLMPIINNNIIN